MKGLDKDGNIVEFNESNTSEWRVNRWVLIAGLFVLANAIFWIWISC